METRKLFDSALLSEAAYADFSGITNEQSYIDALEAVGFSTAQAKEFVTKWAIVAHQPNTNSGFSATLFQRITDDPVSGYQAGEYAYAIRGSEFGWTNYTDLAENYGNIVQDQLALEQIVDLYNDWIRLTTPEGEAYQVAKLVLFPGDGNPNHVILDFPLGYKTIQFESSTAVYGSNDPRYTGAGLTITTDDLASVSGHSLGGHLAMAFTRLFPGMAEAVAINGAGFGPEGTRYGHNTNIPNLFGMLGGAGSFDQNAIQNIYGDANLEFVAQHGPILFQPGQYDALFIEDISIANRWGHGIRQMTDSLAVYDLFIRLDENLANMSPADALIKLKPIFESASHQLNLSLESIVLALGKLVAGLTFNLAEWDRPTLYENIELLKASTAFQSFEGNLNIVSMDSLSESADLNNAEGYAYRYALQQLNPFVITGTADLYTQHNQQGVLDAEHFSEQYLTDLKRCA